MTAKTAIARLLQQGQLHQRQGQHDLAESCYSEVLRRQPRSFEALHLLGLLYLQTGQAARAKEMLERAARLSPADAPTQSLLGVACQSCGQADASLRHFERAAQLEPRNAEHLYNLGKAHRSLGQLDAARGAYEKALALNPAHAAAESNLSEVLSRLDLGSEALVHADRALALRPGFPEALSNRGAALNALHRYNEALDALNAALELKPGLQGAHSQRGNALLGLNRFTEACPDYLASLAQRPDDPYLQWNFCLCLMMTGNFREAWPYYSARWQAVLKELHPGFKKPAWHGERISGTLLVWGEQGLGDQLMYSSMLQEARGLCGRLRAALAPRLIPLLERSFPDIRFCTPGEAYDDLDFDAYVCVGDLVTLLRSETGDFLAQRKAYLQADRARSAALRQSLSRSPRLLCGLSWISKNDSIGNDKSLALAEISRGLSGLPADFIDLQYGDTAAERENVRLAGGIDVCHVPDIDTFNDIDGLAALIEACDVVVTISNTTAHLAGALGKRVFLMLPHGKGRLWCWQNDRSDALWYPKVRIFRQPAEGDWASVIRNVRDALAELPLPQGA